MDVQIWFIYYIEYIHVYHLNCNHPHILKILIFVDVGNQKKFHSSVCLFIYSFNLREMQSILFFINFKINKCERMKINIHYKNTFFFLWNSHYTALNNLYYNYISISCLFIERGMDWWGNSKIGEGCQQISRRNTQQVAEDSRHGWPNHGWSELTQLLKLKFRFFHLHRNVCLKS